MERDQSDQSDQSDQWERRQRQGKNWVYVEMGVDVGDERVFLKWVFDSWVVRPHVVVYLLESLLTSPEFEHVFVKVTIPTTVS